MAEEFSQSILIKVVAQICEMVGFDKIMTTPLVILADIIKEFIIKLGRLALGYGEHCGRSFINLTDLSLAFQQSGINPGELAEFLKIVSPLPECMIVPKFPVVAQNMYKTQESYDDYMDSIEMKTPQPYCKQNIEDSREALKIKISLKNIGEVSHAKKRKHKKKTRHVDKRENINNENSHSKKAKKKKKKKKKESEMNEAEQITLYVNN